MHTSGCERNWKINLYRLVNNSGINLLKTIVMRIIAGKHKVGDDNVTILGKNPFYENPQVSHIITY